MDSSKLAPNLNAANGEVKPLDQSSTIRHCIHQLGNVGEAIAAFLILMLAALIGYEVIARYVFHSPTGFANQIAAYSMPAIALLAAGATLQKNEHVSVDALVNLLPPNRRLALLVFTEAFSVILLMAVTYLMMLEVHDNWQSGTRSFSTLITFPEYIPQFVMPIGLALLTLHQALKLADSIRDCRALNKAKRMGAST
ncbi:TRAP transporter small permease [Alcaligenaceae bacterium]|nr:TRAP transporter small permease [Alcaligenaceae bacterium]